MINTICAAGIGIILFAAAYIGFRAGVRLGMTAAKGQMPAKLDPVGGVIRTVQNVKNAGKPDPLRDGLNAMLAHHSAAAKQRDEEA
jgi:hypothetical protein